MQFSCEFDPWVTSPCASRAAFHVWPLAALPWLWAKSNLAKGTLQLQRSFLGVIILELWELCDLSRKTTKPQLNLYGYGSKLKSWGYAGFSLWFHLPRCHFGTTFLSHSHVALIRTWLICCFAHPSTDSLRRFFVTSFVSFAGPVQVVAEPEMAAQGVLSDFRLRPFFFLGGGGFRSGGVYLVVFVFVWGGLVVSLSL